MNIFPSSPMPGGTTRSKDWNVGVQQYDSGDSQGLSPYVKPLYEYNVPFNNMMETQQSSIWAFWDLQKGPAIPFLFKDPYDFAVNSVLGVRSGITSGASLYLYDTRSYMVRADATTINSFFSTLSGYVRLNHEYFYDQDTGILSVATKAATDVWGVRSMQYYKKVRFVGDYSEASPMWNVFNGSFAMREMP